MVVSNCFAEIFFDDTFQIQINATFNVARLLGLEAAKRKVKAYVRMQHPFFDTSNNEKDDIKPTGSLGTWWHESMRVLASIEVYSLIFHNLL